jgi:hypothetical protein
MKTCSRCAESQSLIQFGTDRKRADGKTVYCKTCLKEINRVIRKRHNEKRTQYNRRYRNLNREKYNEWERSNYQRNADKLNANAKKWRDKVEGTFVVMHLAAKDRARRKQIDYVLTPELIKKLCEQQCNKCALTGISFDYSATTQFRNRPFAPSIDRKDSRGGYTLDNIQITCVMVNKAKNEYHQEMFDEMCLARVSQINGG